MPAESPTSAQAMAVAATVSESTTTTTTTTTTISNKDVFISLPDKNCSSSSSSSRQTLVFLIPGNPGLIRYYEEFLSQVRDALQVQVQEQAGPGPGAGVGVVGVAGLSLGGFEVDSSSSSGGGDGLQEKWVRDVQVPPARVQTEEKKKNNSTGRAWGNARGLFGLRDQIELCHARVEAIVGVMRRGRAGHGQGQGQGYGEQGGGGGGGAAKEEEQKVDVILIGHSVGAYIALEVIKLWNERRRAEAGRWTWTPKAAILLMPTVIDLHKSPSGQIATPLLSTVPFMPELLQSAASALRYGLPPTWLKGLVSRVTGMKESQGLETTVNFVASARGVNEALHLARDEVAQIRADKWGEEIWGAAKDKDSAGSSGLSPALYFLFAQQDHWVADATRKEIVDVRGGNARRIVIDEEEGLAHAWPLRQTGPVVKIVLPWIQEVLLGATERPQQASKAE